MSNKKEKPLIKVENLQRCFRTGEVETLALKKADFSIFPGEFVAIMGPSGSGKSTLMHIIGFLDKATKGKYVFKGKNVNKLSEDELADLRNQAVGFIFQSFNLLPRTTVFENVRLPLMYSKKTNSKQKKLAEEAIKSVSLLHRRDYMSNQLSGGEKQRVAIARALVNEPDIILADEPTGNLDSKSGGQIMKILQDLNEKGKTIIMVTHEQYTAEHARRIINIRDGSVFKDTRIKQRRIKDGQDLIK
ncbi:MAG TPA: ABC transporter ATP-binding protein [Patescibacteria group bacterium]|nr:ABC transporter ATP-binding protein [Patescibacteria group bacterium]